jgi:hypothetical protein
MEKIIFTNNDGQQIYNIHATLKVTFDVDAVVAQLLEENRPLGFDIELSMKDVIESVRSTIDRMAYLAEHHGSQVTLVEKIIDNNWGVY